jgi:hypothetical protein
MPHQQRPPTEEPLAQSRNSGRDLLHSASSAFSERVRARNSAGLADPRLGFAIVELLHQLGKSVDKQSCDSTLQAAALRVARALIDMNEEQNRLQQAVLVQCACPRQFRIDMATLTDRPITCGVCSERFAASRPS